MCLQELFGKEKKIMPYKVFDLIKFSLHILDDA